MRGLFDSVSHIIFDLDGLLVDSEPLWKLAEQKTLAEYGKVWQIEIARQHIGVRIDQVAEIMVHGYQVDSSPEVFGNRLMEHMFELIASDLQVMSGAVEAIQKFHAAGLTLAIASSSSETYIRAIVEQMNWTDFISIIASACNVPQGKPSPDVYLDAVRMLGTDSTTCLAFEDSVNGAKAAHAARIRVCAIPGHDFHPADFDGIANVVYPSLNDVLHLEFGANLPIE